MKRVMIIAGEASADLHAGKLVRHILSKTSDIEFFGIGGNDMRNAGVKTLVDSAELAVVGLIEVLAHRKVIFGALHQMEDILKTDPPDLLVLIDYPEFNLRLARTAKECNVKVLYYIGPQVWAWRQKRVEIIRQRVDMMAVVFPFEEAFYKKHNVPVEFVGHPLTDELIPVDNLDKVKTDFNLRKDKKTIGLFPGSRRSEIKRLLPIILSSAKMLNQRRTDIQFILPVASTLDENDIKEKLAPYNLDIIVIKGKSHEVIQSCDVIITVSGTVTLEIALFGIPQVVINKVAWLTYYIVKPMLKIPYIALCNIVAGKQIVPELIQQNATPVKIVHEVERYLDEPVYINKTKQELATIRSKLGSGAGIERIADLLVKMVT
ncbi:MAG: lipid-A-disaccharide synthase [Gammaproteobacteria bacterium]|nr:lipid-A-disaccharide synthase [Gammaproteobacteria bacterium]